MADFDVSIIAKLIDQVTAPARAVTESLKAVQNTSNTFVQNIRDFGAGFRRGFMDEMSKSAPQIQAFGARMSSAWSMISGGAKTFYSVVSTVVSGALSLLRRLSMAFGITGAGMVWMAHRWAETTDELFDFAKSINIAAPALRALQYAAEDTGVGAGKLNSALEMMSKNIGLLKIADKEEGGGPLLSFLEKVGDTNLINRLKQSSDTAEQFRIIMEAVERQTDRSIAIALASAAFGRGVGADLVRMAGQWRELANEQVYYTNLTKDQWKTAETASGNYTRALLRVGAAWEGMKTTVLAPVMDLIAGYMTRLAEWLREPAKRKLVEDAAIEGVKTVAGWVEQLIAVDWSSWGRSIRDAFESFKYGIEKIKEIYQYIKAVQAGLNMAAAFSPTRWLAGQAQSVEYYQAALDLAKATAGEEGVRARNLAMQNLLEAQRRESAAKAPAKPVVAAPGSPLSPENMMGTMWDQMWGRLKSQPEKEFAPGSRPTTALEDMRSVAELLKSRPTPTLPTLPPAMAGYGLAPPYRGGPTPEITPPFDETLFNRWIMSQGPGGMGFGTHPPGGLRSPAAPPAPAGGSWWDIFRNLSPISSAAAAEAPAIRVPMGGYTPGGVGPGGLGGGTATVSALRTALSDLTTATPASLAANAPVSGIPPTGITIQARGPTVEITQAPPSINVAVTVNVSRPDEAPNATAMATGEAIARQFGNMSDNVV